MNLGEWIAGKRGRRALLHRTAGVNYGTIELAIAKKLKRSGAGSAAERLSQATGGEVRPVDMLELDLPEPEADRPSADNLA